MAIARRVTYREGEPHVVITIDGYHDAFRFAWAMCHLQVEFCREGYGILGSLKRKLGAQRFGDLAEHLTGKRRV